MSRLANSHLDSVETFFTYLTMQTLMNASEALICARITAPTLMEATHVLVDQDIVYQLMAVHAMV